MTTSTAAFTTFSNIRNLQPPTYSLPASPASWWAEAEKRLEDLVKLPDGWDGYDGSPVRLGNVRITTTILNGVCRDNTPIPQFVPVSRGGLQVEWHAADVDIEIYIANPGEIHAIRTFVDGREDEEVYIRNDFSAIVPWIRDLEASVAATAAAA